jgi:hypothetical protein
VAIEKPLGGTCLSTARHDCLNSKLKNEIFVSMPVNFRAINPAARNLNWFDKWEKAGSVALAVNVDGDRENLKSWRQWVIQSEPT